uniref:Uncharacterized protein n=1 Tax=Setaria italica TaxID=4555 RepID=K4A3Q4_SETIT
MLLLCLFVCQINSVSNYFMSAVSNQTLSYF